MGQSEAKKLEIAERKKKRMQERSRAANAATLARNRKRKAQAARAKAEADLITPKILEEYLVDTPSGPEVRQRIVAKVPKPKPLEDPLMSIASASVIKKAVAEGLDLNDLSNQLER